MTYFPQGICPITALPGVDNMFQMAVFIILVVSIIANLLLIAVLYFLPYPLVNALRAAFAPNKPAWSPRRWVRAAIAVAIMIMVPLLLNSIHHYERRRS